MRFLWFLQIFPRTLIAIWLNLNFHCDFNTKRLITHFRGKHKCLLLLMLCFRLFCFFLLFPTQLFTCAKFTKIQIFYLQNHLISLKNIFNTVFSILCSSVFVFIFFCDFFENTFSQISCNSCTVSDNPSVRFNHGFANTKKNLALFRTSSS